MKDNTDRWIEELMLIEAVKTPSKDIDKWIGEKIFQSSLDADIDRWIDEEIKTREWIIEVTEA